MRLPSFGHGMCVFGAMTLLISAVGVPLIVSARQEAFLVEERSADGFTLKSESGRMFYVVTGGCQLFEGDTVYIDSTFASWPVNAKELLKHDYRSDVRCDIIYIHEISRKIFLTRVVNNDNEAVVSYAGADYLIEFDTTCRTVAWRYREREVLLYLDDILDAVGDSLVMPSGEACDIWSAQRIGRSAGAEGYPPCPAHSHDNPKDLSTCVCDQNYVLNDEGTKCIAAKKCPAHSSGTWGQCKCEPGYKWQGDACISFTLACKDIFGSHALGDIKSCYCEAGYRLNASKTTCVKNTSNAAKKASALDQSCGKNRRWRSGTCVPIQ